MVDNMPPKLLVPLVDMMTTGANIHKLAAVVDVRSRDYFDDLSAVLSHLDDLGVKTRILFLDASNEVLIKRYESVRRPHPLQQGNRLIDGILEERDLLENLKERADIVIDTSSLSIHQLSTKLYEGMLGSGPTTVSVHIFSFGFKYGIPIDADFVADVRFLPNPFWCRSCVRSLDETRQSAITCFPAKVPPISLTHTKKRLRSRSKGMRRKINIM